MRHRGKIRRWEEQSSIIFGDRVVAEKSRIYRLDGLRTVNY
jgi:hypothetical protein